jgi:hypothetical protein
MVILRYAEFYELCLKRKLFFCDEDSEVRDRGIEWNFQPETHTSSERRTPVNSAVPKGSIRYRSAGRYYENPSPLKKSTYAKMRYV